MYDRHGITYAGRVAKSKTGKPCLKWRGLHGVKLDMFSGGIYPENYCRNINMSTDYAANPWCMVTPSEYEDCNITFCGKYFSLFFLHHFTIHINIYFCFFFLMVYAPIMMVFVNEIV